MSSVMQDVFLQKTELRSTIEEEFMKSHSVSMIEIKVERLEGLGELKGQWFLWVR